MSLVVMRWAVRIMEVLLATNSKEAQDRAEASFKRKEQRARDGAKAMAEYEAAGVALRKKTARLKALRLAKEGAELEAQVKTEHVTSGR
jgi:hypothetical protein